MLIVRVYSVLDSTVVEVSCVHGGDPLANHLVYREDRRCDGPSLATDLQAAAWALENAAYQAQRGEVGETDDCGL